MEKLSVKCPAKINLNLKILGKRSDGFHEIESIMQTIDLYDYLTIFFEHSTSNEISLKGDSNLIPYDSSNLVYKAAKLFMEYTGLSGYKININIEKNIPVSAGLAGGSTDAAGTLYALDKILKNISPNYSPDKSFLDSLCAKLGSDLNVCLNGGRILAKGRGEIIEKLPFEDFDVSLIKPLNLGISAKEAYTEFSHKLKTKMNDSIVNYNNHLEWAIIDNYKELQYIKQKYPKSTMTGSGSAYYMVGENFKHENGYWVSNGHKSIESGVELI